MFLTDSDASLQGAMCESLFTRECRFNGIEVCSTDYSLQKSIYNLLNGQNLCTSEQQVELEGNHTSQISMWVSFNTIPVHFLQQSGQG